MIRKIRIWLAPILMIVLLIAHETAQGQFDDTTAADRIVHAQPDEGAKPMSLPLLSILEAKDLPGHTVTIKGKVVSVPSPQADGFCQFVVEDETGSLLLSTKAASLQVGDIIQVTGKLGISPQTALLRADRDDIFLIR